MDAIINWIMQYGYLVIFSLLMLGIVGLPVPDEILLTCVGYLIFSKILHPLPAAGAAFLGSVCGISMSYLLGRALGLPLIEKYGWVVNLRLRHVDRVRRWFNRIGKWTLTVGYFFPGVRHFTGFVAGTSKLQVPVFAGYAYLGALLWALTFISLGYFLGEEWPVISGVWLDIFKKVHLVLLVAGGVAVIIFGGYLLLRLRRRSASPVPMAARPPAVPPDQLPR